MTSFNQDDCVMAQVAVDLNLGAADRVAQLQSELQQTVSSNNLMVRPEADSAFEALAPLILACTLPAW